MNNKFILSIQNLIQNNKTISNRIDFFQGAGGNVSAKVDQDVMVIKSSGVEIKEMNEHNGFSVVNYSNIYKYFLNLPKKITKKIDEETVNFINNQIIDKSDYESIRPSIETGFHSILKKYVIHSHSVYVNILACCSEFENLVKTIFCNDDFITIRYSPPGSILTKNILTKYQSYFKQHQKYPEIIFLQNHGLIVHSDDHINCRKLHSHVNNLITNFFSINETQYPKTNLIRFSDSYFQSQNKFFIKFFKKHPQISSEYFNQTLFPDQTVYFQNNITFNFSENKKVKIGPDKIEYHTNEKEANTIEETLIAYLFIRTFIEDNNYICTFLAAKQMDYIHDLESEKYRKKMLKK